MAAAKALLVLLATASGYKLTKSNESSISLLEEGELPECKGLPLQGSASGADEWQCDTLHGELGTSDEFKCTNRYDAGVDGKVYLQCAVHAKSNKAFNCLASQRCIPNANAAQGDANRCHCDPATGTAAMGANCKVNLAYECESCLSAFYLASDLHCKRKICTCPSGTGVAAEGADCPTHDTLHCASCTTAGGYVMDIDGKTCIEKLCTCDAGTGTAAKGVDCPTHKSGKCQTCADGYIFKADGLSCKQKQCTCLLNGKRAGEGASGTTCDTDGMNKCASCDDAAGYVMDAASDLCIVKQCTCTAGTGTAASGAACDTHQAVKCASCDTGAGFKMADDGRTCICDSGRGYESAAGNTCVFKKCTCSNGKLAQGTDCPSNGNAKCMSCDAGFRLEKDQCLQNLCTCNHGTAVSGASCDVHQKHECAACTDANYELINGKCVYKICTCANGDRAEGSACPNHGAKKCAKCDGGFRLGAGSTSCLQNVCSCANGNAATGASCDVHDAHKCASCKDSNYQLISNKCEYKTCTCTSGTRAEGSACPAMSDAKCVSCNTGFHMSGVSCKQNVCSCSNGNAATGTSCDVNNEHKCASCVNGDYALISEKCVYKSCKCSNGAASQGSQCDNHNTNECQSCNAGYHEVKSGAKITSCNQNTCSCSNGNAATGASCSSNNAAICASCSNGYQLSGSSCSLRTCTCSHGTGHTGTGCYDHGKESCSSCNSGYELKNIGGRNKCRDPVEETRALIQNRPERVATSWGDPHVKVFDHQWDRAKILSSYHHNWATENLNVMEPGTWWLVKTPGNMVSIQGVYGWGWRAVNRRIAITGKFIKGDRIRVHPRHTHGTPQNDQGCYYKYAGGGDSQLIPNRDHSVNWNNNRNDVTMVYKKSNQGLAGDQWRVHLTMPLYIDLEVNCYNHHVDLVIAMRKIDGQSGDFGNMDGSFSDEMKRNPNVHDRNGWWSKVINGGTRVSHGENIHSNWYDVPPKPHGAVLLEASKRTPNGVVGADDQITVDGVDLNHHDDGTERGLDCTDEQEKAAFHLCHDMLKVNQSVVECMTDVCQQGPRLAAQTNVVEREVEEDEDEETVEHYQIYDGGSLYHTCFHAQDIFTKVSAMPRDVRELNLILALASSRTLLGIRCAGSTWVYVDGAPVPYDIASKATCVDKKLMCVDNTKAEGQQVFTCDSAEKTACQIPRMYACRADVKYEDRDTACPGGMQPAMPVSVRDIGEAQKAMDSDKCTTHQAWTGYVRGPNENPICFYEGGTHTAECSTNADQEKNVMCETKFG
mmetsp:Transcript_58936/g.140399  ORF Transcript_58936/g.140399 Transcript_58936/m.140399 type:complete len:1279 (+) Transcript_58936:52-3888(+)